MFTDRYGNKLGNISKVVTGTKKLNVTNEYPVIFTQSEVNNLLGVTDSTRQNTIVLASKIDPSTVSSIYGVYASSLNGWGINIPIDEKNKSLTVAYIIFYSGNQ